MNNSYKHGMFVCLCVCLSVYLRGNCLFSGTCIEYHTYCHIADGTITNYPNIKIIYVHTLFMCISEGQGLLFIEV